MKSKTIEIWEVGSDIQWLISRFSTQIKRIATDYETRAISTEYEDHPDLLYEKEEVENAAYACLPIMIQAHVEAWLRIIYLETNTTLSRDERDAFLSKRSDFGDLESLYRTELGIELGNTPDAAWRQCLWKFANAFKHKGGRLDSAVTLPSGQAFPVGSLNYAGLPYDELAAACDRFLDEVSRLAKDARDSRRQ